MLARRDAAKRMADGGARIVIVADDLTGALDAAAPFATPEAEPAVATRISALAAALATGAPVVAVSTRSREADETAAAAGIRAVLAELPAGATLFKKIDSRLKGPIAAELAALGRADVVALPAVPEFGRVVRAGLLSGFGVDAPIAVRERLGVPAAVPDTVDAASMDAAVAAAAAAGAVIVGARGASAALARAAGARPVRPARLEAPLLIVVGSRDPITLAQVRELEAVSRDGVELIQPGVAERSAAAIGAALAAAVAERAPALRSLVLTGGATAEVVLDGLGIDLLALEGEVQPGLPVSRAGRLRVVTKSGGFGAPDALARLAAEAGR